MTTSNLQMQFGQVMAFRSYQLTNADCTAAATTQTITLDTFNQGSVILYARIKHSVAFAGTAITAVTLSLGKSGGSTTFFLSAFNVFQTPADGTLEEAVITTGMGQLSACKLTATFTSVGGNLSAMTAGTVNIDVLVVPVSTPTYVGAYTSGQVL